MPSFKFLPNLTNSPEDDVSDFYAERHEVWNDMPITVTFGYRDDYGRMPCIIIVCGKKELVIGCQESFLLKTAIENTPEILKQFEEWTLQGEITPSIPKRTSSTKPVVRRYRQEI